MKIQKYKLLIYHTQRPEKFTILLQGMDESNCFNSEYFNIQCTVIMQNVLSITFIVGIECVLWFVFANLLKSCYNKCLLNVYYTIIP